MASNYYSSKTIFDLPTEMLIEIGKYLSSTEIFIGLWRRGKRNPDFRVVANKMLAGQRKVVVWHLWESRQNNARCLQYLQWIADNCHHVKILDVHGIKCLNDDDLLTILQHSQLITEFHIIHCPRITYRSLVPLFHCKNLTKLSLRTLHFAMGFISNKFLQRIGRYNNNLTHVNFCASTHFSNKVLKDFVAKQPKLEWIGLEYCKHINIREVLPVIAKTCKNLKYLNIYDCQGVDYATME